jgi:hypothetical protein
MFVIRRLLLDLRLGRGYMALLDSLDGVDNIPAISKSRCDRSLPVYRACAIDICYIVGSLVGQADKYREIQNGKWDD